MATAFDRVVLTNNDKTMSLTAAEFFALPLAERLRAIFERRLEFYAGNDKVDSVVALQSIRERKLS
jgi:hypothetical protein